MLDSRPLDEQLADLKDQYAKSKDDLAILTKRFDEFSGKLRFPGTKFLVDLEYKMVEGFPKTFSLISLQHLIPTPGTPGVNGPFDIRKDNQHAFYIISAKVGTTGQHILYEGTTISTTCCTIAYAAANNGGLQETWLDIYNGTASTISIDVALYRRIGIK